MAVEIRAVSEQMEAALKRVPALRRKVVESVTQKVKARLDTEIASRVRDTHGKIRGWQEIRIGFIGTTRNTPVFQSTAP